MNFSDLKTPGVIVMYHDQPHQVIWSSFVRKQQRQPVIQTKLRNLISGKVLEYSFKSSEPIESADITKQKAQYLYFDESGANFMNSETFETVTLPKSISEDKTGYLKEGQEIVLIYYGENPISIELPAKVDLRVIDAPPSTKGNTSSGGNKPATLETGLVVPVPLFINIGDIVRINTSSGLYTERVSK